MFNRDKFKFHFGSSIAFELTTEYPQQIHFHQFVWVSNTYIKSTVILKQQEITS